MTTQLNNVYLRSGGKLSLALGTDPTRVYGSTDADVVTIAAGVSVVLDGSFNRGNDIIRFTGNAASYSVVRVNASTVRITDAAGTSVTIPVGSAGTAIEFADATRTLSGSSAGILLGNQTITATPVALAAGTAPAPVEEYVLTSSAPSVTEGNDGTKTLTYLLTLNKAPTSEVTVNYQTTDAGTAAAGDDFQVVAGIATFAPGQTATTVSVTVYADTIVEADETVALRLSGSKLVAAVDALGTIRNDDSAPVDPTAYTVTAGDIAAANASNVPVTLNIGNTGSKTVTIQSDGASATQGIIINGDANATVNSGAAGDKITISGNGTNTINTGGGNDNVSVYGSGTNTINVGTGNDTVVGGTGDETVIFAAGALGAGDVVDGGAGNDTVRVSGDGNVIGYFDANNNGVVDAGDFNGANLIGVENIIFDGTTVSISAATLQTLIQNGLKSITGSNLTTELTIVGLEAAPNGTLNLSGIAINGGLEKITTNGSGTLILNTTQANQIAAISASTGTLTQQVIVNGPQSVAMAEALIASGVTAKYALSDTAANLALASVAVFNNAQSITATTAATAAQAEAIAAIESDATGFAVSSTNFKVNVTDTAEQLATRTAGLGNATNVTATTTATVAEASQIRTLAAAGSVTTTLSYAVSDTLDALKIAASSLLTGASSVKVIGEVANLADLKTVNDNIGTTNDGKTVVAGYTVNTSFSALTNPNYAAEVAAAGDIIVAGALQVSQANAIEALNNTGSNKYTLNDSAASLLAASPSVVANAAATNAVTANDAAVNVTTINALAAKYSKTALAYTGKVVDTAVEIVKLTPAALAEIGAAKIEVTGTSTATVNELLALNTFLTGADGSRISQAPAASTVKVRDTAANLESAVKVPTTLAALDASASVEVSTAATVKQILDINTKLAGSVVSGYTLQDSASNLTSAAAGTAEAVDSASKVTVTGTVTLDQIDTIVDRVYASGGFAAADLGTKIVYSIRDTATGVLTALSDDGNGGNLSQYRVGASNISITDTVVSITTAKNLLALKATTKFDGVYSIGSGVSELNNAYADTTAGGGREALLSAQKVTLLDSVSALSDAAGEAARGRATVTIASDNLSNLTNASSALKAAVSSFSIVGSVSVTDASAVSAVNALSALKPTTYTIGSSTYADLIAGNATFLANASNVTVSDALTVAKAANLVSKTSASVSYNIVDTAANIANASASVLAGDPAPEISAAANAKVVTVAQAVILEGLGVTGYTISDTAANISAAPVEVLSRADGNAGGANDGQGVVINDGAYAALSVEQATKVFGTTGAAAAKYDLVDTAAALSSANSSLVGFARNVTATSVATPQQASNIAGKEPKGTLTFDVTGSAADLATNYPAGTNAARNVTVDSSGANLAQAKALIAATNSGTLTYKLVEAGSTLAADLASTNAATKADVLAAINGATSVVAGTVNGADATVLAAVEKAISYSISDSAVNLSALTVSAAALNEAVNITVTGAVKAAFAATVLGASNSGTVAFTDTANGGVSGTSAELAALKLGTGETIDKVTATTFSTVAEAKVISALASSKVYGLSDTAANLASASSALLDGATLQDSSGNNIVATTAATVAQAIVIDASIATAKYQVADTYSNLMANSDTQGAVDAYAALTSATKVTVADGPISMAQATDLVGVGGSVSKYVYAVTDRDAAIASALINNGSLSTAENILLNATAVTGENGVSLSLKVFGSNVYITGTKAELAALSPEFKAATVAKLVVADVAALNADPLYYSALPTGTSLRVEDSYSNLNSGNALVRTAASVVVKGSISASDAAVVNGWTATQKIYDLSDTVANLFEAPSSVLNGAANISASGTANAVQAQAILAATGATSVTIAAASMNATEAVAMTYGAGDKITALTVTGTADMTQAGDVRNDILAGNVGSATYSISDVGTSVAAGTTAAAALRNGATNITTTGSVNASEAQLILSATNVGKTTVAAVTGTPAEVAKLVADSNDTITQITVAGDMNNVATVAQALAIAALDARTGTSVTYNFTIVDTAEAILAAPLSLLDAVDGVTVKGAVSVATASQLLAIDTADTTIAVSLEIKDSVTALKAAPLAVATSTGVTKVTVDGAAKVADISAIDTAFTNVAVGDGLVYELNDRYTALGANTAVSNGAAHVTVDGAISVGQASIVYGWAGTATYSISASPMSVAAASNAVHVKAATSITLTGPALVSEAKLLSEMTNLSGGYTIKDAASAIFNAYNAINGANAADYETIIGAKSVSLSDDASVAQLVGNATQNGISALLSSYTIYDDGDVIAAALANPTNAALVENATQVALKPDLAGMKVDSYVAITSEYGARFIGYDSDRSTTQVEGTYKISDTATNVLIADEAIIARAASVMVNGTSLADTIDLSSLGRGVIVNAGAGADTVTGTAGADQFNIAAGDTVLTVSLGTAQANSSVTGFDRITNFAKADGTATSELLNVQGSASIVANGTVDITDVTLNNAGAPYNFKSYVVNDGIVVFHGFDVPTGGSSIPLNMNNVAGAVAALQAEDLGSAGATIAFLGDFDGDSQFDDLGVFTQGSDAGTDNSLDTLVFLLNTGVVSSLVTTNTQTANALFIA